MRVLLFLTIVKILLLLLSIPLIRKLYLTNIYKKFLYFNYCIKLYIYQYIKILRIFFIN